MELPGGETVKRGTYASFETVVRLANVQLAQIGHRGAHHLAPVRTRRLDPRRGLSLRTLSFCCDKDGTNASAPRQDDRALFITAHNSLVTYTLTTSSTAPILSSVLDSPLRPLLWCATFSKQDYEDVGEVVLAGGSMLGDILLWRLAPDPSVAPEPTKLLGHNVRPSLTHRNSYLLARCRAASSTSPSPLPASNSRASATIAPSSSGTSRTAPAERCGVTKGASGA